jgi:hypothetical protein
MLNDLSLARCAPHPKWCRASLELAEVAGGGSKKKAFCLFPLGTNKTFSLRALCDLCERRFNLSVLRGAVRRLFSV